MKVQENRCGVTSKSAVSILIRFFDQDTVKICRVSAISNGCFCCVNSCVASDNDKCYFSTVIYYMMSRKISQIYNSAICRLLQHSTTSSIVRRMSIDTSLSPRQSGKVQSELWRNVCHLTMVWKRVNVAYEFVATWIPNYINGKVARWLVSARIPT